MIWHRQCLLQRGSSVQTKALEGSFNFWQPAACYIRMNVACHTRASSPNPRLGSRLFFVYTSDGFAPL